LLVTRYKQEVGWYNLFLLKDYCGTIVETTVICNLSLIYYWLLFCYLHGLTVSFLLVAENFGHNLYL